MHHAQTHVHHTPLATHRACGSLGTNPFPPNIPHDHGGVTTSNGVWSWGAFCVCAPHISDYLVSGTIGTCRRLWCTRFAKNLTAHTFTLHVRAPRERARRVPRITNAAQMWCAYHTAHTQGTLVRTHARTREHNIVYTHTPNERTRSRSVIACIARTFSIFRFTNDARACACAKPSHGPHIFDLHKPSQQ